MNVHVIASAKAFTVGQDALDVCKIIVGGCQDISTVRLVSYIPAVRNWRQLYPTAAERVRHVRSGFERHAPVDEKWIRREDCAALTMKELDALRTQDQAWAMCSRLQMHGSGPHHIPMMNFHSDLDREQGPLHIEEVMRYICPSIAGVILDSGRHYHYYGAALLTDAQWVEFLGRCLMAPLVASSRYIGHTLQDGCSVLRITAAGSQKAKVPEVVRVIK